MKKNIIVVIAVIFALLFTLSLFTNSVTENDLETNLRQRFKAVIVYKNSHRGIYLYLNTYNNANKFKMIREDEIFNKPNQDNFDYIIYSREVLYNFSKVGDTIEKLSNSNKCYLYRSDSIFRYNLYDITESERQELEKIDEWNTNEVGFFKKENVSN